MLHNICTVCQNIIDGERLNVLINVLNTPPSEWRCLECAKADNRRIKGIYTGFSGASELILANSVGQDVGVSQVFNSSSDTNLPETD